MEEKKDAKSSCCCCCCIIIAFYIIFSMFCHRLFCLEDLIKRKDGKGGDQSTYSLHNVYHPHGCNDHLTLRLKYVLIMALKIYRCYILFLLFLFINLWLAASFWLIHTEVSAFFVDNERELSETIEVLSISIVDYFLSFHIVNYVYHTR